MHTLGIETSVSEATITLLREHDCLGTRSLERAGRRHAQTLVAEAAELFRDCGLAPGDCRLAAVSIGPGSFTGLRVGVVFAKTLAYAAGCDVIAVDTFQAVAEQCPPEEDQCFVIGDAQRGELFVARYRRVTESTWQREGSIAIRSRDAFLADLRPDDVVTGPGVDRLPVSDAAAFRILTAEYRTPRAESVARIGRRQWLERGGDDPAGLEPLYFRRSAAEEKRDAQQSR